MLESGTRNGIALAGCLLLLVVAAAMGIASRPARFSADVAHPRILDVEVPQSPAELMWLLGVDPGQLPAVRGAVVHIRARIETNLAWDRALIVAYFLFFVAALLFTGSAAPPGRLTVASASMAGAVMLAACVLDYRENAALSGLLTATAGQQAIDWEQMLASVRSASLLKWAALGGAMLLFSVTHVLAARGREPSGFESFRALASALGGLLGLVGSYRGSRGLISGELLLFSSVAVSLLVETGAFSWRRWRTSPDPP